MAISGLITKSISVFRAEGGLLALVAVTGSPREYQAVPQDSSAGEGCCELSGIVL